LLKREKELVSGTGEGKGVRQGEGAVEGGRGRERDGGVSFRGSGICSVKLRG